jgi:hypothetical protein
MSQFQYELRPMLKQFSNAVGRGNLIAANATLVTILESMAMAIDRSACSGVTTTSNSTSNPTSAPSPWASEEAEVTMDDSFNMDDFIIEYDYKPVPAYEFIRFEVRITDDLTIEVCVVEARYTQPNYLAITREVAHQG